MAGAGRTWKLVIVFLMVIQGSVLVIWYQGGMTTARVHEWIPAYTRLVSVGWNGTLIPRAATLTPPAATLTDITVDYHDEDPALGHVFDQGVQLAWRPSGTANRARVESNVTYKAQVAMGMGLTTAKLKATGDVWSKMPFFHSLLVSFCKTVSPGYHYHFYIAFDVGDSHMTDETFLKGFAGHFVAVVSESCTGQSRYALHFLHCTHKRNPAWAQNDAMMQAYVAGMDYFYRVNDDSVLSTPGWTDRFIATLGRYTPPNVGVVGPRHSGGNVGILTYDFVHRTHVEVFGFHYPRCFRQWYADAWITNVYKPGRSTKLPDVRLKHTMELGQRYGNGPVARTTIQEELDKDKDIIQRYIQSVERNASSADGSHVISMALYGYEPSATWGAIRNAQLLNRTFPGWKLRVYIAPPGNESLLAVPVPVLDTLRRLGVELWHPDRQTADLDPRLWSHLVADDPDVRYFLIRDPRTRLTERDARAVSRWLASGKAVHCVRDHAMQAIQMAAPARWGAATGPLLKALGSSMRDMLLSNSTQGQSQVEVTSMINERILDHMASDVLCHDSVSCAKWKYSIPFPGYLSKREHFVGALFDSNELRSTLPGEKANQESVNQTCISLL